MFITKQNKKAQGMSLNVVIIAALALLVLVILSIILVGRIGKTRQATEACVNQGGTCVESVFACQGSNSRVVSEYACPNEELPVCCISV
ncbi:hypothetical protein HYS47_03495 [Candidatus Woesearchaeota archaeon]|nr:hypothetical protein [Candidatus Woesearchaeota archaeon]